MYALEANPDEEWYVFPVSQTDILLINHHLSEADGPEAVDVLKQTRAALYELLSGEYAVNLASSSAMLALFDIEVRPMAWMYDLGDEEGPEEVA